MCTFVSNRLLCPLRELINKTSLFRNILVNEVQATKSTSKGKIKALEGDVAGRIIKKHAHNYLLVRLILPASTVDNLMLSSFGEWVNYNEALSETSNDLDMQTLEMLSSLHCSTLYMAA